MRPAERWRALERDGLVGRFRLLEDLPASRAARRYRACSPEGLQVLVQVCHPEVSLEPTFTERFFQEVQHYPSLYGVLAWGTCHDLVYVAQPPLRGSCLRSVREHGSLPVDLALACAGDVVDALNEAHARGVCHRNLSPDNVRLTAREAEVTDYGLFCESHRFLYTPFTAPEQRVPKGEVGPWSDQYSLGRLLLWMLGDAPTLLEAVLTRMTNPVPEDRYPDLTTAREALEAASQGCMKLCDTIAGCNSLTQPPRRQHSPC